MSKKQKIEKGDVLILNEIINQGIDKTSFKDILESIDFTRFSDKITLESYQSEALRNAIIALMLFKECPIPKASYDIKGLLALYQSYDSRLSLDNINRASFWMATGSGKTIVMIKLIAILARLMHKKELESKPIMLLAPNDKILEQFKNTILLYNNFQEKPIQILELKEYEKQSTPSLFESAYKVYIARSDLLDNEANVGKDKKAKRLNYKNYLRENGWYILLDEAHRGDSGFSTRKSYINELAKGLKQDAKPSGFIFNFSATFDDEIDMQTCAFNYNLERFNLDGYGKNIAVLDSDLKAFSSGENEIEQLEKIMQSFIIFTAILKAKKELFTQFHTSFEKSENKKLFYHNPLIIAVSDKVNTQIAGIKLYFEAILKIVKGEVKDFEGLLAKLCKDLEKTSLYFGTDYLANTLIEKLKDISLDEVRQSVFYAKANAGIEACKIKGNDKELVFKSKNASKPFLLLNIGNIKEWQKEYIIKLGIDIGEDLEQGYFAGINETKSPINIMMGSKVFSEGWDSNRVNIINFINIGSTQAKKYVLQTIGRGVRIEPFAYVRKRLEKCTLKNFDIEAKLGFYNKWLETLFIMASDKEAIKYILEKMQQFSSKKALKGFRKNQNFSPLYVPKYKAETMQEREYKISCDDYEGLCDFIESYDEDVLLLNTNLKSEALGFKTLEKIKNKSNIAVIEGRKQYNDYEKMLKILDSFFTRSYKVLEKFEPLNDEIKHFHNFTSTLSYNMIEELNQKIKEVLRAKSDKEIEAEIRAGKSLKEAMKQGKQELEFIGYTIDAELKEHYYSPLISKENDNKISYSIKNKSEIDFLKELKEYIKYDDNILKAYEWCFSKLVENIDEIYIPYFDEEAQSEKRFYPDFIFWLRHKKTKNNTILFIDPKGLKHAQNIAINKIEGFKHIFAKANSQNINVKLFFYNEKQELKGYDEYIKTKIKDIFASLSYA
ncbi:DEAD/DEAH box helicase family protein [Campylobacter sp. MIT 97-5078]|uniref:DEAD/DEAH box helicase family protein n=1 Tax=Campylobacter sp. MIT 97-5078 TaxID=1548153 RepID=UPI0005137A42|nr:DEAD/DEAH box helicase family protein [Campylobacter sp. MIT 97-5078]KGI56317.1 hypothetical protein LR59_07785 [Campylobacter sp. MIT 97-5078]KGI57554.1 hypothetical protein LR59_02355 [Campylobacter sp. MIT 97-5078]KGI57749.1 hypothetical protein LR59_03460 [Campylobacter sp. MIT 97-5078]TQR26922.1 hypothetical protein DMB91_05965 [Campylobacter sp. MIT 97-5078]